jgi:ribosomal protein L11 methyltransferase
VSWIAVRVHPHAADRATALAALFAIGSTGVHEDGDTLVTCFPAGAGEAHLASRLRDAMPRAGIELSALPDTDWSSEWKTGMRAHVAGAITVVPPWLATGHDPAHTVIIDPGMAFGTGDHATTRGVLRLLSESPVRGARVADLGAGSCVLAIAAAKLGAARVIAIEHDADAIPNAMANVAANDVAGRVTILEGDAGVLLPLVAPVDLVLANIVSSVLLELLPVIARCVSPAGSAILGGILVDERTAMLDALTHAAWHVTSDDIDGEWWSISIIRA